MEGVKWKFQEKILKNMQPRNVSGGPFNVVTAINSLQIVK